MTSRYRIAVATAALTMALAAYGCGEGPGPPEIGRASSGPITEQRVGEFARAVNLRADDLPGAEVLPAEDLEADPELDEEAERCFGEVASPDPIANDSSPSFRYSEAGEVAMFQSVVSGARTEEELSGVIAAFNTAGGFRCLERVIRHQLKQQESAEAKILAIEFSKIHRALPIGSEAFGLRIHVPFESGETEQDSYSDLIFFMAGHAEVTLTALGMPTPVNQDVESGLVAKLAERAERHAL